MIVKEFFARVAWEVRKSDPLRIISLQFWCFWDGENPPEWDNGAHKDLLHYYQQAILLLEVLIIIEIIDVPGRRKIAFSLCLKSFE